MAGMKIAVLLSGGVDSSVALRLLAESGEHQITAYYLKIWLEDELAYLGNCPWEEDLQYARAVCEQAGVALEVMSLQLEYFDRVVEYALEELKAGRTPSPDIFCNQRVKFGAFFEHVEQAFDKVATGHYAQLEERDGVFHLLRAPDPVKDQSYFLSHLSQAQLSRLLFPVGHLHKAQVRELAARYNLPNKDRKDSQGICFLGKIPYNEFVRHYLGTREGPLVEAATGKVLGTHLGFWFHTVGQRSGLGLGNGPWYVSAKDCTANIVYVSHAADNPVRGRCECELESLHWTLPADPDHAMLAGWNDAGLVCKLRHGPVLVPCQVEPVPGSDRLAGGPRLRLVLTEPDAGIAAGQFAVLYLGEHCLGGGKICEAPQALLDDLRTRYEAELAAQAAALAERGKGKRKAKAIAVRLPTPPRHVAAAASETASESASESAAQLSSGIATEEARS